MRTCAIDFETGGLDPHFHEPIGVAIIPLKDDFTPDPSCKPFIRDIGVDHLDRLSPMALKVNGKTEAEVATFPPRKTVLAEFFEWSAANGKFAPLAQNWAFDRGFLQAFIDPTYIKQDILSKYVDYRARDLARVVMFAIDKAKMHGQPPPFKGTSLGKIAETLGIENPAPHTGEGDAITAALCYAKLLSL